MAEQHTNSSYGAGETRVEEADFKSDSDRRYFRFRQFMLIGGPFLTELSRGIFLNLQFGLIFSKKLY